MKHNKVSRILGIGLTIAVLASMFVVSAPVSAGNAVWSVEDPNNKPPTVAGIDVLDMAVAGNGSTAYAVASNAKVYKTTNGGATWLPSGDAAATKVAVAPDVADGSFAAIVVGTTVVVSVDGGATWGAMAALTGNVTAVSGISIAPAIGGARSIAVAATRDGANASVQYFTSAAGFGGTSGWVDALNDGTVGGWTELGPAAVTGNAKALAIHYSTNFLSDRTIVVVTADAAGVAYYNLANVATKKWNSAYTVYGITTGGKVIAAGSNVTAAAIELPNSYMAFDSTLRMAYVALEGAVGGLYRASNWTFARLSDASMHSVAVNAAGDKLVAGAANSNNVYRVATPATALADSAAGATKAPGWTTDGLTTAVFLGASVGAATVGEESAFGLSADDGKNFNDVAFIDTTANLSDLAVKADGTKTYVLTEGTTGVTSLWRKTTAWERVFKIATGTGWIVRPALDNFDVIYLANCTGGTAIWYSNDAGQATWQPRISYQGIYDLQVESTSVLYVLNAAGSVSKAVDGGYLWDNPLKATGAGAANNVGKLGTLTLLAKDNLLASGATGVAYTTDGGATWTSLGLGFVDATQAVADKLTTGGIITAAAGTAVKTFTIGTSAAFSATNAATLPAGYAVSEMIISGGVTYAMADDGTNSIMLRSKITALAWSQVALDAGKLNRGLAAASGKLISRNKTDNSLWSYTDVFAAAGPALTGPAEAFIVGVNLETGNANNVVFQWTGITGAPISVRYTMQMSLDSAFTQVVATVADFNGVLAIIGPTGAAAVFPFQADTSYYWRVRASLPVDGPYSATRSFKIGALQPLALSAPASGASDVSVKPTFVWAPVTGATTYEIVVSDDPTFKIITFSRTTDKSMFAADEQLAYGTNYYWRVRASAPTTAVTPFVTGIFTTEAKPVPPTTPAPPITITTQPPATITVEVPPAVEAIPAFLLWIIILIGAILVIALIVLIVRTRRTS